MMFTWENVSVGSGDAGVGEAQVDHDLVGKVAATVQIFLDDKEKINKDKMSTGEKQSTKTKKNT